MKSIKSDFFKKSIQKCFEDENYNEELKAFVWFEPSSIIVIAFAVYQLIQAFQKHGKK